MLGEGAQEAERRSRVNEEEEIGPQRETARRDPGQNQPRADKVQKPCAPFEGARRECLEFAEQEAAHDEQGTDKKAPRHRVVNPEQALREAALCRPAFSGQIPGFRIFQWICQPFVPVMSDVALAVVLEGQPKSKVGKDQKAVQPAKGRGVAMNHFMLQGTMPGDQIGAERKKEPCGQFFMKPGHKQEAAIDGKGHQDRRPAKRSRLAWP